MRKRVVSEGPGGRGVLFTLLWAALAALLLAASPDRAMADHYAGLKRSLIEEGFSRQQVEDLFRPVHAPMFGLVSKTLRSRETPLDYDHFLTSSEVARARDFIAAYRDAFSRAESAFGVEPGVIAAILLVETNLGSYTGKTSTPAVFSTFAVLDRKENRDLVWKMLPRRDRRRWGREAFDQKLLDRSRWAYRELVALLECEKSHNLEPQTLRGSVMGAVGLPQFLPSSLQRYGADGNGDGRIDLFDPQDAIFSTANYLRGHGWGEARFPADREQVIWAYNHSRPYVRAVLGIAERLGE
jgi:membrane-bound lytic murein transglycosylase B